MRSIPPGCLSRRFLLHFLFQNLYMHITKLVFLSLLVCVQGMRHFPRQSYSCIRKSVLKLRVKQKKKVSAFWVLLMIESSFNMWQFHLHSSAASSKAKFLAIDFFFLMEDDYLKGEKISWWSGFLLWKIDQIELLKLWHHWKLWSSNQSEGVSRDYSHKLWFNSDLNLLQHWW